MWDGFGVSQSVIPAKHALPLRLRRVTSDAPSQGGNIAREGQRLMDLIKFWTQTVSRPHTHLLRSTYTTRSGKSSMRRGGREGGVIKKGNQNRMELPSQNGSRDDIPRLLNGWDLQQKTRKEGRVGDRNRPRERCRHLMRGKKKSHVIKIMLPLQIQIARRRSVSSFPPICQCQCLCQC